MPDCRPLLPGLPQSPPSSRLLNKPKDAPSLLALKVEGSLPLTQMAESPAPGLPPGRTGCLSLAPLPLRGGEPHWAGGIPLGAQPPLPQPRLQSSRTLHSLQRQNPLPWLNSALVHGFPTVAQRPQAPLGAAEPQFPTAPARVQHLEPHHHHNATVNCWTGISPLPRPTCPALAALQASAQLLRLGLQDRAVIQGGHILPWGFRCRPGCSGEERKRRSPLTAPSPGLFTKRVWGCHCTICSVPVTPGQEGNWAECPRGLHAPYGGLTGLLWGAPKISSPRRCLAQMATNSPTGCQHLTGPWMGPAGWHEEGGPWCLAGVHRVSHTGAGQAWLRAGKLASSVPAQHPHAAGPQGPLNRPGQNKGGLSSKL